MASNAPTNAKSKSLWSSASTSSSRSRDDGCDTVFPGHSSSARTVDTVFAGHSSSARGSVTQRSVSGGSSTRSRNEVDMMSDLRLNQEYSDRERDRPRRAEAREEAVRSSRNQPLPMTTNEPSEPSYRWTPLHKACTLGNIDDVRTVLRKGGNVNRTKDPEGSTALHLACERGYDDIVRVLLEVGASMDARDAEGFTPLHSACINGFESTVELLLENEADFRLRESRVNDTALHLAAKHGHAVIALLLISDGCSTEVLNSQDASPLYLAIVQGHTEVVKVLLSHGATLASKDKNDTALNLAVCTGMTDIVNVLLEHGHVSDVNKCDEDNWRNLHWAAHYGSTEIAQALIAHGAYLPAVTEKGDTALHMAALCSEGGDRVETVRVLVQNRAPLNVQNSDGSTPLHNAALEGDQEVVKILVKAGARHDLMHSSGFTALHMACMYAHFEAARELVLAGAKINATANTDSDGVTPLGVAINSSNHKSDPTPLIKLLKSRGAR